MRLVFAGCGHAVVARAAGAEDLRMVNREDGLPDVRAMAVFTDVTGLDVRLIFAGCGHAVVAGAAGASKVYVIEIRRQPGNRRVAVVACVAAGYVRRMLAQGGHSIMTSTAGPEYLCVIDRQYGRPRAGRVTVFTEVAGLNVSDAFAGRR